MSSAILMMTSATAATGMCSTVIAEPHWCTEHYEPSPTEAYHQHDDARVWGNGDEKVRVGLTRYDADDRPGQTLVDIQYLADGVELTGSAALDLADAREYALAILQAVAEAEKPA